VKILVADDSAVTRTVATRLLKKQFACDVIEAKDGLETITLLDREDVDALLLDVGMPVLSGIDVLAAVRSDPRYARLPVVVMTSTAERATAESLIRLGVMDYLLKPLHVPATSRRLADVFARISSLAAARRLGTDRPALLVVGLDPELSGLVAKTLGERFDIREEETSSGGLRASLDARPAVVFLGEGLPLLSESVLARKMRADGLPVFLCTRAAVPAETAAAFTGVIVKASGANDFALAVERALESALEKSAP
jgi:CheY-like chemotaxis protein